MLLRTFVSSPVSHIFRYLVSHISPSFRKKRRRDAHNRKRYWIISKNLEYHLYVKRCNARCARSGSCYPCYPYRSPVRHLHRILDWVWDGFPHWLCQHRLRNGLPSSFPMNSQPRLTVRLPPCPESLMHMFCVRGGTYIIPWSNNYN